MIMWSSAAAAAPQTLPQHPDPGLLPPSEFQGAASQTPTHGVGAMVHWKAVPEKQSVARGINNSEDDDDDDDYRPFTPPPPRERLSYTRHQLEMLNGIYREVRYPNSTQKQLIAKRVGITREQVKIWFQNRRRKDIVTKTGKMKGSSQDENIQTCTDGTSSASQTDNQVQAHSSLDALKDIPDSCRGSEQILGSGGTTSSGTIPASDFNNQNSNASTSSSGSYGASSNSSTEVLSKPDIPTTSKPVQPTLTTHLVSPTILRGMIAELNKFDNEYLKLKKSKKKKNKAKSPRHPQSTSSPLTSCKSERLFQKYDMVAPPNKVTPTAFLNTSVNKFKHAVGTSAFQNPRKDRFPITSNDGRLWEGLSLNHSVSGTVDSPDFMQQKSTSDLLHPSFTSPLTFSTTSNQSPQFSNYLAGKDGISSSQLPSYDNLPVLSDLLGNYKNHPSSATAIAAAAATAHRQELPVINSGTSNQPPSGTNIPAVYFHLSGGSSGIASDHSKPPIDPAFPRSSLSLHYHPQASTLAMNRIFPFSLVADPPVMLSSSRQPETFRHPPQWPHSMTPFINSQTTQAPVPSIHGSSSTAALSLPDDHYRPLMISSLSNPYFSAPSSTYSVNSSSLPSQSPPWSLQPLTGSDTSNSSFTQM